MYAILKNSSEKFSFYACLVYRGFPNQQNIYAVFWLAPAVLEHGSALQIKTTPSHRPVSAEEMTGNKPSVR